MRESRELGLWSAVLLQARSDIGTARMNSPTYHSAVAFFTSPAGQWAESRRQIADLLDLDAERLQQIGESLIASRQRRITA